MITDTPLTEAEQMAATVAETIGVFSRTRRFVMWLRGVDAHALKVFNTATVAAIQHLEERLGKTARLADQLRGRLLAASFEIEILQEELAIARGPKLMAAVQKRMRDKLHKKITAHNAGVDAREKPEATEPLAEPDVAS